MLGPEYWSALNHTTYFKLYGKTPEQVWFTLRRALEEGEDGDWEVPWKPGEEINLPYLDLEHTVERGFVVIEDSSGTIAQRLDDEAQWDRERPWLRQWAAALRKYPDDVEMRARALINLPDSRIIDPDGPLGCIQLSGGWWMFVGFLPIDDADFDYGDPGEAALRLTRPKKKA